MLQCPSKALPHMEQQTHILQTSQPKSQVTNDYLYSMSIKTRTNLRMPLMWCTSHQDIWDPLSQPTLYKCKCYLSLTLECIYNKKNWGFSVGKIVDNSLLSNLLFGCATNLDFLQLVENLASSLSPLLSQNLIILPFFQTYVTVFG